MTAGQRRERPHARSRSRRARRCAQEAAKKAPVDERSWTRPRSSRPTTSAAPTPISSTSASPARSVRPSPPSPRRHASWSRATCAPRASTLSAAFAERRAGGGGRGRWTSGLASTDFLYFASGYLDVPGAMFTASHNPAQYNGIKLCLAGAKPIGAESGLVEIEATDQRASTTTRPTASGREYSTLDLTNEWVTHVHSFADVTALSSAASIVADTANGMGGSSRRWSSTGCPLTSRFSTPSWTGTFPTTRPTRSIPPTSSTCSARARDRRRRRTRLRRRRGSRVPDRRARASGERIDDDRDGGGGHAGASSRRDGALQPDLLEGRARGDRRGRAESACARASVTATSSR